MNDEKRKQSYSYELSQSDLRKMEQDDIRRMWTGSKLQLRNSIIVRKPDTYYVSNGAGWTTTR